MKVLFITELFPPECSGGGWSTYHLAHALDATDEIDVTVLAVNQNEILDDGLDVEHISVRRFPNELAYYQIAKEIKKREADYDIIQGQHSLTIPPLGLIKNTPTVGVIRDYWPVCYRTTLRDRWGNNHLQCGMKCLASTAMDHTWTFPYKVMNHHLRAHVTKNVDVLAARSEFVEERLNDHGFEHTDVLYNFVPDGFADDVEPTGEGDILYVGKLHEQKGPQLLVDAIPEILEEHPNQTFTFLGDGPLRNDLEQKVRTFGVDDYVKFLGHIPMSEVKSRMKGAQVVVSPSLWHEPLSRVILEAQALGTPVVTTDRGGNREKNSHSRAFNPDSENIKDPILKCINQVSETDSMLDSDIHRQKMISSWIRAYKQLLDE